MTALPADQHDEQPATNWRVPVELALPQLADSRTVPGDLRVAVTNAYSIFYGGVVGGTVLARDHTLLPVAGLIVTDDGNLTRNVMAERAGKQLVILEVFPAHGPDARLPRSKQLAAFARKFATALAEDKIPVIKVPSARFAERHDSDRSGPAQAFFAGVVAGALAPNGVMLCAYGATDDHWGTYDGQIDSLALAASQGRAAIVNRRIENGAPEWSHVATQLARFQRQFRAYHDKRVAAGGHMPAHFMWNERDPRCKGEMQAFAPHHSVMLGSYPKGPAQLDWMEPVVNMFRPGSNYEKDPIRTFNAFRRWLLAYGPQLAGREQNDQPLVLTRPAGTTPAHEAVGQPAKRVVA